MGDVEHVSLTCEEVIVVLIHVLKVVNPMNWHMSHKTWNSLFDPYIRETFVKQEGDKMTEAQFVRNHRGIDQGKDPPKEMLEGMYRRIKVKQHSGCNFVGVLTFLLVIFLRGLEASLGSMFSPADSDV